MGQEVQHREVNFDVYCHIGEAVGRPGGDQKRPGSGLSDGKSGASRTTVGLGQNRSKEPVKVTPLQKVHGRVRTHKMKRAAKAAHESGF